MSHTLTILRHAKSSWESADLDRQRPLNERGRLDAELMANYLSQKSLLFDSVYCSSALRTQQTWQIINASLNINPHAIYILDKLYLANLNTLLAIINQTDSSNKNILLLGHNPGLTELCNYIARANLANLPTCGLYSVELLVDDWQAVTQGVGKQSMFCTPRILKDED